MSEDSHTQLLWDSHTPWSRDCPYEWVSERLSAKGVEDLDPDSSARQVSESLYHLMGRDEREMLDEIRYIDRRLVLDFFHYQMAIPGSADLKKAIDERPLPLASPGVKVLVDIPIESETILGDEMTVDLEDFRCEPDVVGSEAPVELMDLGEIEFEPNHLMGGNYVGR